MRYLLTLFLTLFALQAIAQTTPTPNGVNGPVRQFGPITAGHTATWKSNNYIQDGGSPGGSGTVTSLTAGTGLSASPTTITTTGSYSLLKATTTTLGGIIVGSNLSISTTGVLSASGGSVSITAGSSNIVVSPSPLTGTGTVDLGANLSVTSLVATTVTGTTGNFPTLNAINAAISGTTTLNGLQVTGTTNLLKSVFLGPGLTNNPGSQNSTPLVATSTGIYPQTFPLFLTTTQGITSASAGNLNILNNTTSSSNTIPTAGSTGFAIGTAFNFLNIGAGALNITVTGSNFNGLSLSNPQILTLPQYGYATCIADANNNYDCAGVTTSGGGSSSLGNSASATNPGIASDATTGLYTAGAAKVDIAISGTKIVEFSTTSGILNLVNNAGQYEIGGQTAIAFPSSDSTSTASIAIGNSALAGMTTSAAYYNTAVGWHTMASGSILPTAVQNLAFGAQSLFSTTSGNHNIGMGISAGYSLTSGSNNSFIGGGYYETTGNFNTSLGIQSLNCNGTGSNNTAISYQALACNGSSTNNNSNNTVLGSQAGLQITTGSTNTIIGQGVSSSTLTTGSDNILIGVNSAIDTASSGTGNTINIGGTGGSWVLVTGSNTNTTANTVAHGVWNMPNLASSSAATTGTVCWTTSTGLLNVDTTLGCLSSLEELKDIQPGGINHALDTVMALKPFWYTWKKETPEYKGGNHEASPGFGAHQVESVDKRLVGYGADGKLRGVKYEQLTPLLAAAIQEQQKEIDDLQRRITK